MRKTKSTKKSTKASKKIPPYDNDRIRAEMTLKHQTVEDVAQRADVAPKTVSAIRNGKPQVQVDKLKRVVDAVGLPMAEIFRERAVA
jgi:transcriptional regulator with XRE-family HTH domain